MDKVYVVDEIQKFFEDANAILPRHDNRIFTWAGLNGVQPSGNVSLHFPDMLRDCQRRDNSYYNSLPSFTQALANYGLSQET